jgi:RimJ/RimL family protein N-acetyltransferase
MTGADPAVIRPATSQDFDSWFALYDAVAAEGRWIGGESPNDRDRFRQGFERRLESGDGTMLLAEVDGELVGNLGLELRGGLADLGMMIGHRWRGQGIGTKLLESGIAWATEHRAHKITLAVWPHNIAALGLYRKFGFVEEAHLRRHYRRRNGELWDAIGMGLVLDEDSPGYPYH